MPAPIAPSRTGRNGRKRLDPTAVIYDKSSFSALRILASGAYSTAMTRSASQAAQSRPDSPHAAAFGQVLPFRRPGQLPLPVLPTDLDVEPADDLAQYEQAREQDQDLQDLDEVINYRQRTLMNVIAMVVITFLVSTGVWLADTIGDMERDQDCMMQGRVNCAPLELALPREQ